MKMLAVARDPVMTTLSQNDDERGLAAENPALVEGEHGMKPPIFCKFRRMPSAVAHPANQCSQIGKMAYHTSYFLWADHGHRHTLQQRPTRHSESGA